MEIRITKKIIIKNKNKKRKGPDSEPKMRYFKIPLCRNFVWKVGDYSGLNDACQWCLRSKIGVWQMPLCKFLRPEIWSWNLWFDWSKRLKYKVHHFWPKMLWMLVMQLWMQDGKDILTGTRNHNGIPEFVEKGIRICYGIV